MAPARKRLQLLASTPHEGGSPPGGGDAFEIELAGFGAPVIVFDKERTWQVFKIKGEDAS
jgi:hypothetical protein